MGVNWDSGLLRWKDHAPGTIERYPLSHPHPFIQRIELESAGIRSAVAVDLYISLRRCEFARGFTVRSTMSLSRRPTVSDTPHSSIFVASRKSGPTGYTSWSSRLTYSTRISQRQERAASTSTP